MTETAHFTRKLATAQIGESAKTKSIGRTVARCLGDRSFPVTSMEGYTAHSEKLQFLEKRFRCEHCSVQTSRVAVWDVGLAIKRSWVRFPVGPLSSYLYTVGLFSLPSLWGR